MQRDKFGLFLLVGTLILALAFVTILYFRAQVSDAHAKDAADWQAEARKHWDKDDAKLDAIMQKLGSGSIWHVKVKQ